jgi:membrane protease YdiL (CAAX protease family)
MATVLPARLGGAGLLRPGTIDTTALGAAAEAAAILTYLLSYIWIIAPRTHGRPQWPAYVLFIACTIASHALRRESLADIGLRFDNLRESLAEALVMITPTVLVVYFFGVAMGETRHMSPPNMVISVAGLFPWALFQQYGLVAVFSRRLRLISDKPFVTDVGCATIFALLHLPNPLLMSATFGAGYCVSVLFRRSPNLFALALAHALVSSTIHHALPDAITLSMSVGPGCLLKIATG